MRKKLYFPKVRSVSLLNWYILRYTCRAYVFFPRTVDMLISSYQLNRRWCPVQLMVCAFSILVQGLSRRGCLVGFSTSGYTSAPKSDFTPYLNECLHAIYKAWEVHFLLTGNYFWQTNYCTLRGDRWCRSAYIVGYSPLLGFQNSSPHSVATALYTKFSAIRNDMF